jgi:hypothetical protein
MIHLRTKAILTVNILFGFVPVHSILLCLALYGFTLLYESFVPVGVRLERFLCFLL